MVHATDPTGLPTVPGCLRHLQAPEASDSSQDPAVLDGSGWRIPPRCPRLAIAVSGQAIAVSGRVHQRRVSMNTQVAGLYTA